MRRDSKDLKKILVAFEECDEKTKNIVRGLCDRAVFMNKKLRELEEDIDLHGMTELFCSPNMVEPSERKRVQVDIYNAIAKNYATVIKGIKDALPKQEVTKKEESDGFDDFVNGRDEK